MGSIYKITNTVNGKSYIGQTINDVEKTRVRRHLNGYGNEEFQTDIEEYGKDVFMYEILHDGIIPEFLDMLETEAIAKHNTVAPHGYNLRSGGSGGSPSEETRRKISEAQKGEKAYWYGKKMSAEARRKMSESRKGENNPFFGKKHSADIRRKMSEAQKEAQKGKPNNFAGRKHTEESRHKMSESKKGTPAWNKGVPPTADTRSKMSEAKRGENHPNYGKKLPPETCRKISESQRGKPRQKHSAATRKKMSESHKGNTYNLGKTQSAEVRQKRSLANKGEGNPFFGKKHSADSLKKMSESSRHSTYYPSKTLFHSLPADMPLSEKRKRIREFSGRNEKTVRKWTREWEQGD